MAKYSNTKAKINEKIATNGRQAVTGAILNDVLQTMVDSLGADYQFGGLVQPGSSFTAGEQPVVFLATTPGTYTNFGGLVVADGEVALLVWSGTAWSKQTPDIATKTEVSQLGQEINFATTDTKIDYLELSETLDKAITAPLGSVGDANNFAYTQKFYATKGDVIIVKARGYLTSIAMISKVITEDNSYEVLVHSTDSTVKKYYYIVEFDGYYAASYNYNYEHTIALINNSALTSIKNLSRKTAGASVTPITFTRTINKFIDASSGHVVASDSFAYTSKFFVEKGYGITVKARGYLTAIAMISKVITEDSEYEVLVSSVDSAIHEYTYIVEEDGYYAASFSYLEPVEITVSENTPDLLLDKIHNNSEAIANLQPLSVIKPYVQSIDSNIFYPSINETTITIAENGKFILAEDGSIASSESFSYSTPITLQKGQTIVFRGKGYYTAVALVSKVISAGSKYSPKIIGDSDNVVKDWVYVVEENGDYAFSFSNTFEHKLYVIDNKIFKQIVGYIPVIPDSLSFDELVNTRDILFAGVPKIGMIGDSLMSGAWYNPYTQTPTDYLQYSWYKVLERDGGNTYVKLCAGGMSAHSFARDTHSSGIGLSTALQEANKCQLYIIGLEVNDRNYYPNDLGTPADIDLADPENNAQSFYGDYAYIIQKITASNQYAKFIVFTNPRSDSNWNDAIRYMPTIFNNVFLCDLFVKYNDLFGSGGYYDRFKDQSAHYPAMAYASMGKLLEKAISETISYNLNSFKDIQGE